MKTVILLSILFSLSCAKQASKPNKVFHALGHMGATAVKISNNSALVIAGIENEITKTDIKLFQNNSLTKVSDLKKARYNHTAEVLPNGKILVVGGYETYGGENAVSEIEEIDPQTFESNVVAFLNIARGGHTMTQLNDGRFLIAGGTNGAPLNTAEIYNPNTHQVEKVLIMNESRSDFQAIKIASGEVVLLGGFGSNMAVIEKFNSQNDSFARAGVLAQGRFIHEAVLLNSSEIFIAGGYDAIDSLDKVEIYNPQTETSRFVQNMEIDRDGFSIHKLSNGNVLVIGGADMGVVTKSVQIFQTQTETFVNAPSLMYAIESHTTIETGNDLIIFGGTEKAEFFKYSIQ